MVGIASVDLFGECFSLIQDTKNVLLEFIKALLNGEKEPIDLYHTMCQLCILTWNEEWPRALLPVSFVVFVEIEKLLYLDGGSCGNGLAADAEDEALKEINKFVRFFKYPFSNSTCFKFPLFN